MNSHWKMMPDDDHIIYFQNVVLRWHNHCYGWIHTEKWCLMMLDDAHIIYFQNVVSRWHNHCYSWIHTEKWCIMHIHTYKTKKLPNMVSPITKWTLPLNSHRKNWSRTYIICPILNKSVVRPPSWQGPLPPSPALLLVLQLTSEH